MPSLPLLTHRTTTVSELPRTHHGRGSVQVCDDAAQQRETRVKIPPSIWAHSYLTWMETTSMSRCEPGRLSRSILFPLCARMMLTFLRQRWGVGCTHSQETHLWREQENKRAYCSRSGGCLACDWAAAESKCATTNARLGHRLFYSTASILLQHAQLGVALWRR
jgi:hypothetical protein